MLGKVNNGYLGSMGNVSMIHVVCGYGVWLVRSTMDAQGPQAYEANM